MKISIHQPYFAPYRGHFRLLSDVDLHVVLDDVQHIRRGWVHRNQLRDSNGKLQWLTLPLAYAPQDALIKDLRFTDDAEDRWHQQAARFPAIHRLPEVLQYFATPGSLSGYAFVPYAVRLLQTCASFLGIESKMFLASHLNLPPELRGQDRILAICQLLGAKHYLNAPGGRPLYDEDTFAKAGIKLEFLPTWTGPFESILETLAQPERRAA